MLRLEQLDLDKIRQELDEERKKVRAILEGKIPKETKELVKSVLFVVESPNKARTIASFFGKPSIRKIGPLRAYETTTGNYILTIVATKGHIYELTLREEGAYGVIKENNQYVPIFSPIKKCLDCGHQFTDEDKCPKCGSTNIDDASERIKALRELAEEVDIILIGTDPDVEGEKIAFDVYNALKPYNHKLYRAEFHEVTKYAILKALQEVRDIDKNLVKGQLVRRIEDRWIGFALSQKLWAVFKKKTLSAGRVQTPVLGWVIERFEEYKRNRAYFYAVKLDDTEIIFTSKEKLERKDKTVKVEKIKEDTIEKNPLPPYTTDTMLRDAVMELRMSVDKIMQLAQDLFEWGLCVAEDTLVVAKDGKIDCIKNLENEKELFGFKNFKIKENKVEKYWKIPYKGKLYTIELENGITLRVTPDHGLLAFKNNKVQWVSAKYLQEGDYLALAFKYREDNSGRDISLIELLAELGITNVLIKFDEEYFNSKILPILKEYKASTKYKYIRNREAPLSLLLKYNLDLKEISSHALHVRFQKSTAKPLRVFPLDEKFWYLVGLVLGDGSLFGGKAKISQSPVKRIKEFIRQNFDFSLSIINSSGQVVIYNSLLAEIFSKLGLRKGELHPLIFTLKDKYIFAIIAGYFDTDGTFSLMYDRKNEKHSLRIAITSKREDVLRKIQLFLLSKGIRTSLIYNEKRDIYDLIFSNRDIEKFKQYIYPYLIIRRRQFEQAYLSYAKEHPSRSDYILVPVGALIKTATFPRGAKYALLQQYKIDVFNYLKTNKGKQIPREKLKIIAKYILDATHKEELLKLLSDQLLWVRIKKITVEDYEGEVYDFTTTTESFIANGVVSHNCTYHRTDSIHVSPTGIQIAKDYITNTFGEEYFKGRSWGPEGTHEAIRPTRPLDTQTLIKMLREGELQIQGITKYHIRLYDLIFRRFIASQMVAVQLKEATFKAHWSGIETEITGYIEIIKHGWDLVKPIELLKLREGIYEVKDIREWLGSTVQLYTQADLIQLMKERNIGRPSTYATIVKKLFDRHYVVEKKQRIIPTQRGIAVYKYLNKKFGHLVSEELTAKLQTMMDEIAEGKRDYNETLKELGKELVSIWESKETEHISNSIAYAFKRKISVPWDLFEEHREKLSRKTLRNLVAEPLTPLSREIYNELTRFTLDKIDAETIALAIEKGFKILSSNKELEKIKESNKHLKEIAKNKLIVE